MEPVSIKIVCGMAVGCGAYYGIYEVISYLVNFAG